MSASRCMHHALAIATQPRAQWQVLLGKLPEACPHADCTGGVGCRERVADYLRVQWRMLAAREAAAAQKALDKAVSR